MGYRELLNYTDVHKQEDVFLSVPQESNSGKSLTLQIAPYVFDLLQSWEGDEI